MGVNTVVTEEKNTQLNEDPALSETAAARAPAAPIEEPEEELTRESLETLKDEEFFAVLRRKFDSKVDYMTTLDNFSGPLDFLLYLMNRDMIPIRDVYVSKVTEQFVAYVQNLTDYDMGKVTEYLNLAADIIKLKLLTLVPNNPVAADDGDYDFPPEDDDPIDLKNALYEEYLRIKKREEKLKDRETTGFFYKRPDRDVGTRQTVFSLDGITQEALGKAMAQIMLNLEVKQHEDDSREIPRDEHTVAQKIVFIRELFEDHTREYDFVGLFTHDSTRGEVVTTFQAILELLKHQFLRVRQEGLFGDIKISFNPDWDPNAKFEIDTY